MFQLSEKGIYLEDVLQEHLKKGSLYWRSGDAGEK